MNPTLKEIEKRLAEIPANLREAYLSHNTYEIIREIAIRHSLDFDQEGLLSNEVGDILATFKTEDGLTQRLQEQLRLSPAVAQAVADNVRVDILVPVGLSKGPSGGSAKIVESRPVSNLPNALQEAMKSVKTRNLVQAIGYRHRLHIDQLGELDNAVTAVLMGQTPVAGFVESVKQRLKIDQPAAEAIAADINQEIFLPIRGALQQITRPTVEATTISNEPPPTAASSPWPQAGGSDKSIRPATIVEQKLGGSFNLPKTTPTPPEKPKINDPYLEPVD